MGRGKEKRGEERRGEKRRGEERIYSSTPSVPQADVLGLLEGTVQSGVLLQTVLKVLRICSVGEVDQGPPLVQVGRVCVCVCVCVCVEVYQG